MSNYFDAIPAIKYEGPESANPLAFKHYNPDEVVLGKTMEEHLRFSACYWHNFCWDGADVFGGGTFNRPWLSAGDPMAQAKAKADAAFSFLEKLGAPFYCFHDVDVAPEGDSVRDYINNFSAMTEVLAHKQEQTGMKLLWGTANVFSHPRYMSGAATNPDPEVFARAATQVFHAMNATKQLGGANYVLWGGREGYETLLNTDLKKERQQLGRFMSMVVEHKHKIGFDGLLLIEPKPQEPTKHQYDYDTATVHGFLCEFGLEKEFGVNIEANHATLSGHSFHHEIASAFALGVFGSIDANRGDPQLGWDTDQFPNSVEEMTLICYEILKNGGYTTGGFNFDTKLRRQSIDPEDLFLGHIGGMDTCALGLKKAAALLESEALAQAVDSRYAGWNKNFGQQVLNGSMSLEDVAKYSTENMLDPKQRSGKQEGLENLVNHFIYK